MIPSISLLLSTDLVFSVLLTARSELPLLWLPMLWSYGVAEITLTYAVTRNLLPHSPTISHLFDDVSMVEFSPRYGLY